MAKTVVGLYDSADKAREVVNALVAAGCPRDDISLAARDTRSSRDIGGTTGEESERGNKAPEGLATGAGIGAALGGLGGVLAGLGVLAIPGIGPVIAAGPIAAGLAGAAGGAVAGGLVGGLIGLGIPEEEAHEYAEGVRRGHTLVMVKTEDAKADLYSDIMGRYNPIDVKQRAAEWRREGWSGRQSESGTSIPVVEEQLAIGKRAVEGGGVHVHSHVVEQPVSETVALREENVRVERQPVDRVIGAGEGAFQERDIEMTESSEEAVVSKQARVKEEVKLTKDSAIREQKVEETLRKTEVEVEKIPEKTLKPEDRPRR